MAGMLGFGALSVDGAYVRMVEQQADDVSAAASRAAWVAYRRDRADPGVDAIVNANAAAVAIANSNLVGGQPGDLSTVQLGTFLNGTFTLDATTRNAARVEISREGAQAVPLFLAPIIGVHDQEVGSNAVVSALPRQFSVAQHIGVHWNAEMDTVADAIDGLRSLLADNPYPEDAVGVVVYTGGAESYVALTEIDGMAADVVSTIQGTESCNCLLDRLDNQVDFSDDARLELDIYDDADKEDDAICELKWDDWVFAEEKIKEGCDPDEMKGAIKAYEDAWKVASDAWDAGSYDKYKAAMETVNEISEEWGWAITLLDSMSWGEVVDMCHSAVPTCVEAYCTSEGQGYNLRKQMPACLDLSDKMVVDLDLDENNPASAITVAAAELDSYEDTHERAYQAILVVADMDPDSPERRAAAVAEADAAHASGIQVWPIIIDRNDVSSFPLDLSYWKDLARGDGELYILDSVAQLDETFTEIATNTPFGVRISDE